MINLAATKENNALVSAIKKISQTKWVGNTVHDSMDKCLTAINLECCKNSGWYSPVCVRIAGLTGFYMVNEDGSLCADYRVIKEDDKKFRIETLTPTGYNELEQYYIRFCS